MQQDEDGKEENVLKTNFQFWMIIYKNIGEEMNREDFVEKGKLVVLAELTNSISNGWDSESSRGHVGKFAKTDGFHENVLEAIRIKWARPDEDDTHFIDIYVHYKDLRFPDDSDVSPIPKAVYFEIHNLII